MKYFSFLIVLAFIFVSQLCNAQVDTLRLKDGVFSKSDYQQLKDFFKTKNIPFKDTVFIKYDFNGETCWNVLDEQPKEDIINIKNRFQEHIKNFNEAFPTALAINFREPGKRINKLKLWDDTIMIDDNLVLKNLLFKKRKKCGTSAVILGEGSYLIYKQDPHFELLELHHNYNGKKF